MPETIVKRHAPRVLIVEDEGRLREVLGDSVEDMGFGVTAVRSAEEALRVMRAGAHEVVILDLQLPVMGGMELFEVVRREWPGVQVIVLTGFGDLETARRAIHLDVVEFLTKPCHLNELEVALDRARRRLAAGASAGQALPAAEIRENEKGGEPVTLAEAEHREIVAALRRHQGNKTAAAAELGISRRTLHYRLAEYRARGWDVG